MDDMAVPQHHRSGAHRARRHPLVVLVATLGAVAVASAALLWVLLSVDVLGVGDELREAGGATPASSGTAAPVPAPSGEVPPASAAPTAGVPTAVTPAVVAPTVAPDPEPSVDRTLDLDVLNGTGTSGLAGAAAEALDAAGWTIGTVGNYDGDEIPTAVLYPEDDPTGSAAATAAAVVADLGVGVATASDDIDVLTVVLGPDYEA